MSLIQYTSDEMFSATDLVRKNKYIFDKIQSKEIQKAIILRDGKPSAIIFDFTEYEKIMKEYLSLKSNTTGKTSDKIEKINKIGDNEISQDDFQTALKEIEKLSANSESKFDNELVETNQKLNDFWEK
jgi:predicted nuclease with TOPRIM domain